MASRRDLIAMSADEIRAFITSERMLIIVSNGVDGYPHPRPCISASMTKIASM